MTYAQRMKSSTLVLSLNSPTSEVSEGDFVVIIGLDLMYTYVCVYWLVLRSKF
jgi:hypothetical protein